MAKDTLLTVRVTKAEIRAVKRYALAHGAENASDYVRKVVVTPALAFDPRQTLLPLAEKEERPRRAG
jgi:hypothetical protein